MKFSNLISIIAGLMVLSFVAFIIYFAGGLSSTYPPLKEYYFDLRVDEFEHRLNELDNVESIRVQITDTTGYYPTDYSIYFDIFMNEDLEFHLKYQLEKSLLNGERIEMDLIGAFDKAKNSGGYRISQSEDIPRLIDKFESEVLKQMENYRQSGRRPMSRLGHRCTSPPPCLRVSYRSHTW